MRRDRNIDDLQLGAMSVVVGYCAQRSDQGHVGRVEFAKLMQLIWDLSPGQEEWCSELISDATRTDLSIEMLCQNAETYLSAETWGFLLRYVTDFFGDGTASTLAAALDTLGTHCERSPLIPERIRQSFRALNIQPTFDRAKTRRAFLDSVRLLHPDVLTSFGFSAEDILSAEHMTQEVTSARVQIEAFYKDLVEGVWP